MADNYDAQHLLPDAIKPPSLDRASNVYCVVEAWHETPGGRKRDIIGAADEAAGPALVHTTKRVEGNGLMPTWRDESVHWVLPRPAVTFLRLSVYHKGVLKDEVIGTEVIPVMALRQGCRSVGLRTSKGLRLRMASILLHVRLKPNRPRPSAAPSQV